MRIAILQTPYLDAVWWYRLQPWSVLARQTGAQISVLSIESPNAFRYVIGSYDVLIVSRPHNNKHLTAIKAAKQQGVKIVADYDDDIWDIPNDNPASRSNNDENFQYNSFIALDAADVVISSTPELQKQIKERFGRDSVIIRNAYNDIALTPDLSNRKQEGEWINVRIAWRGSNTHKGDLLSAREAFRDYTGIHFKFFGYRPDELLKQHGGNISYFEHAHWKEDVIESFQMVREWNPDYLIYPLQDLTFNKCKSNIAWIEATACGAVCIAPSYMPEFEAVPCLSYMNTDHLIDSLEAIDSGLTNGDILKEARQELINNYLLSNVNQLRVDVLNMMTSVEVEGTREGGHRL